MAKALRLAYTDYDKKYEHVKELNLYLRKELDTGNITVNQATEKRKRLSEIQDTLIKNYGLEKQGIDLVNGSLEEQVDLLDKGASKRAANEFDKTSGEFKKALNWVNGTFEGYTYDAGNFSGITGDKVSQIEDEIIRIGKETGLNFGRSFEAGVSVSLKNMTRQEAIEKLNELSSRLSEFKTNNSILVKDSNFDSVFNDINNLISQIQGNKQNWDNFQKTLEEGYALNAQGRYLQQLTNIEEAKRKYEEALLGDNDELKNKTYKELMKAFDEANKNAESKGESFMKNYFNGLKKGYEKSNEDLLKDDLLGGNHRTKNEDKILKETSNQKLLSEIKELDYIEKQYGLSRDKIKEVINDIVGENNKFVKIITSEWSEASKEIKSISDAYKDLSDIVAYANSNNGAITYEMLDKILTKGDEYLKYLDFEGDKLRVNTVAMEEDALAALDAVKAKLIQKQINIIDTYTKESSSLQTLTTNEENNADATLKLAKAKLELIKAQSIFNKMFKGESYVDKYDEAINSKEYQSLQKQIDLIDKIKANGKDFINSLGGGGNGSGSNSTKDAIKEAFDYEIKELKHKLEMDLINENEYYDKLEELNKKYFAGKKDYQEEDWKYTEEVYKGRKNLYKQAYDDELEELQRLHNRKIISDAQYLEALKELNDRYYKDNPLYDKEYKKNLDTIYSEETQQIKAAYQTWINLHDTYISDMDYYNKWSLGQKLNYLAQEQAA